MVRVPRVPRGPRGDLAKARKEPLLMEKERPNPRSPEVKPKVLPHVQPPCVTVVDREAISVGIAPSLHGSQPDLKRPRPDDDELLSYGYMTHEGALLF